MGDTPIVTIDAFGAHKPTFAECLAYFRTKYGSIYGSDVVNAAEDRDSQFLALIAAALDDVNSEAIAAYNSFRPDFAEGAALSSLVKINGIARLAASYSTVDVVIGGVAGTTIENGIVADSQGVKWILPASVVIPPEGEITVTAQAQDLGSIRAAAGTVTEIFTPFPGWQSVTNPAAASVGAPIERDAQLKARQTISASLPQFSALNGIKAAIANLPGMVRYRVYENDTNTSDDYGIAGNSVAVVVEGSTAELIADTLARKKGQGVGTFGTTAFALPADEFGIVRTVHFSRPLDVSVRVSFSMVALSGFTAAILTQVRQAVADFVASTEFGGRVAIADAYVAARLNSAEASKTYRIVPDTVRFSKNNGAWEESDITLAYNEAAVCLSSGVLINLS